MTKTSIVRRGVPRVACDARNAGHCRRRPALPRAWRRRALLARAFVRQEPARRALLPRTRALLRRTRALAPPPRTVVPRALAPRARVWSPPLFPTPLPHLRPRGAAGRRVLSAGAPGTAERVHLRPAAQRAGGWSVRARSAGAPCRRIPDGAIRAAGRRHQHAIHVGMDPEPSASSAASPAAVSEQSLFRTVATAYHSLCIPAN